MKSIEYRLERFMFASRWLLAPIVCMLPIACCVNIPAPSC